MARNQSSNSGQGARSGLPLARAQRLQAQTARIGRSSTNRISTISLVAAGALVFFGANPSASERIGEMVDAVGSGSSISEFLPDIQLARANQPNVEAGERDTTDGSFETAALEMNVPAAQADVVRPQQDQSPEVNLATTEADAPVSPPEQTMVAAPAFTINASAPACVNSVEASLADLAAADQAGLDWSLLEGDIAHLVQATIDCTDAGVRMSGSLQLARTDFADLRLRWDREAWILDIVTVDSAQISDDARVVVTDQALEIVVR